MEQVLNNPEWRLHKGSAFSMEFARPKTEETGVNKEGTKQYINIKEGAVYLQFAKKLDKSKRAFDWQNARRFQFKLKDIGVILAAGFTPAQNGQYWSLWHDPEKKDPKDLTSDKAQTVEFFDSNDKTKSFGSLKITHVKSKDNILIPFLVDEYIIFIELLRASVPFLIGLNLNSHHQ